MPVVPEIESSLGYIMSFQKNTHIFQQEKKGEKIYFCQLSRLMTVCSKQDSKEMART